MKFIFSFILILFFQISFSQSNLESSLPFPPQYLLVEDSISVNLNSSQVLSILKWINQKKWEDFNNSKTSELDFSGFRVKLLKDQYFKKHDQYSIVLQEKSLNLSFQSKASFQYLKTSIGQILNFIYHSSNSAASFKLSDWADFEKRGYMLDISRDKVPTMESTLEFVDLLSEWRINELQLYTEHTFAYKNHKIVWENYSPFTAEEIQKLDSYCLNKGIDLVPNQNSFGHLASWLKHDEYLSLAECETNCKTKWGISKRTSLAPTNPNSLKLMEELYEELLPNFSSDKFNIGGDETLELCLGKSKAACDSIGQGKVYLKFLKQLNTAANQHGKTCQFWGDIILNHPELISEIPKNMTPLVWGYDAVYPFDKNLPAFKNAGLDFYVCPGTSTWRSEIGKNFNAFINLKKAAIEGKKNNAKGYLITDWGDYGHFQPRSISYAPLFIGASYAWNYQEKSLGNLESNLNRFVFHDLNGNTAKAILKLGNTYLKTNIPAGNANAFHLMIRRFKWTIKGNYQTKELNKPGLLAAEKEINEALKILDLAKPLSKDGQIIITEVKQAAALAKFGIHLGLARLDAPERKTKNIPLEVRKKLATELKELIISHQEIWLLRNRPGGLQDSSGKMEELYRYLL